MESLYWVKLIKIKKDFSLAIRRGESLAFIICEHTNDEDLINRIATSIKQSNCIETHFYGKQEKLWHSVFDVVGISKEDGFMMTTGHSRMGDFLHFLGMEVRRNNGNKSLYLFYDDDSLYEKAVSYLVNDERECPLMADEKIDSDVCMELSTIADGYIHPSSLPGKAKGKVDFREICWRCKYHDIDGGGIQNIDMSKPKREIVLDMLEMLFNKEYDPFEFSVEFPPFCSDYYDELEEECEGLGHYLEQEVPDICDEGEPGFTPTGMIAKLKKVYRMARRKIERGGGLLLLDKVTIKVNFDETLDAKTPDGNDCLMNENDMLIVNRLEETIEYYRNVFAGNQISVKYHMEYYIQSLLDHIDARDLFCEVGRLPEDAVFDENSTHTYEIIVEAEGMEPRIIKGRYCVDELPEDYAQFIRLIAKARDMYGGVWGDIFNANSYKKSFVKKEELIYCAVNFGGYGREYHYITDDDTIEEGDLVIVPVGKNNREVEAIVAEKIYCTEETAPYPLSKVKKIIGKADTIEEITPSLIKHLVGKRITVITEDEFISEGIVNSLDYDKDEGIFDFYLQTDDENIHFDADEVWKIEIKED